MTNLKGFAALALGLAVLLPHSALAQPQVGASVPYKITNGDRSTVRKMYLVPAGVGDPSKGYLLPMIPMGLMQGGTLEGSVKVAPLVDKWDLYVYTDEWEKPLTWIPTKDLKNFKIDVRVKIRFVNDCEGKTIKSIEVGPKYGMKVPVVVPPFPLAKGSSMEVVTVSSPSMLWSVWFTDGSQLNNTRYQWDPKNPVAYVPCDSSMLRYY